MTASKYRIVGQRARDRISHSARARKRNWLENEEEDLVVSTLWSHESERREFRATPRRLRSDRGLVGFVRPCAGLEISTLDLTEDDRRSYS